MKANDFHPAFIYELVLEYFQLSTTLLGCFLLFFHQVKLQSLSTTLLQLAMIRRLAVITTSLSDSKMNH